MWGVPRVTSSDLWNHQTDLIYQRPSIIDRWAFVNWASQGAVRLFQPAQPCTKALCQVGSERNLVQGYFQRDPEIGQELNNDMVFIWKLSDMHSYMLRMFSGKCSVFGKHKEEWHHSAAARQRTSFLALVSSDVAHAFSTIFSSFSANIPQIS